MYAGFYAKNPAFSNFAKRVVGEGGGGGWGHVSLATGSYVSDKKR